MNGLLLNQAGSMIGRNRKDPLPRPIQNAVQVVGETIEIVEIRKIRRVREEEGGKVV